MVRTDKGKQSVIKALKEMPIVQVACKRAGVGRATYYRWQKEDLLFKRKSEEALEQGFEYINDMSESQVLKLIQEGKMPAITLWLKHHHPRYGYKPQLYSSVATDEEFNEEELQIIHNALGGLSENVIPEKIHE